MRKIERHLRNLALFGQEHCPRQVEVRDWRIFRREVLRELYATGGVGIRTDWYPGEIPPGDWHLPFLHHARTLAAVEGWAASNEVIDRYTALVCESIPVEDEDFSAAGWRLPNDPDTVLVEWARCGSHRELCRAADRRMICVGPASFVVLWPGGEPVRCVNPIFCRDLKLDIIADMALRSPEGLVEVTVTRSGRVLVW